MIADLKPYPAMKGKRQSNPILTGGAVGATGSERPRLRG
jgi:hypothetical protein